MSAVEAALYKWILGANDRREALALSPGLIEDSIDLLLLLFLDEMRRVSLRYLDTSIIPMLCRKAGIPINDVRGRITSHRARSTIASQLFNAQEPMTLFELQEWLRHSSPEATQHYVKTTPTKLARSYADAGYFARNLRAIEVLIDQESVRNGRAATEPWKFYDLGHGYCTYDFLASARLEARYFRVRGRGLPKNHSGPLPANS